MTKRLVGSGVLVFLLFASPALGGEGLVALNTCDASCPSDDGTYVSCNNGTVTDNRTGLVWLANANCFGPLDWHEAMAVVAGLGDLDCGTNIDPEACDCNLRDHSSPGEWRLPSMSEWRAMIQMIADLDACEPSIAEDEGDGCWYEGCFEASLCSFYGVQTSLYWSSSSVVTLPHHAWLADLEEGVINLLDKAEGVYAWPVRGGQ